LRKSLGSFSRAISCATVSKKLIRERIDATVSFTISSDSSNSGRGGGGLLMRVATVSQTNKMVSKRRSTLATCDNSVYLDFSNKIHAIAAPTRIPSDVFLHLHNIKLAMIPPSRIS